MTPLDTLMKIDTVIEEMDTLQARIDRIRWDNPTDGLVQLQLDRQQDEIDCRRKFINDVMAHIASTN